MMDEDFRTCTWLTITRTGTHTRLVAHDILHHVDEPPRCNALPDCLFLTRLGRTLGGRGRERETSADDDDFIGAISLFTSRRTSQELVRDCTCISIAALRPKDRQRLLFLQDTSRFSSSASPLLHHHLPLPRLLLHARVIDH
jgi:hypothetical protein